MNNRLLPFAAFGVALALLSPAQAARAADGATNGPSQTVPADAPPAPTIPSESPSTGTPAATGAPSTTTPVTNSGERPADYTVVSGDTLWAISHKFDTSIRALKKLNHLKKNNLKPGQVLKIPAAKSAEVPAKKTTEVPPHAASVADLDSHQTHLVPPAQHFDSAGSPFASCPAPPRTETSQASIDLMPAISAPFASYAEPTYETPSGPMNIKVDEPVLAILPVHKAKLATTSHSSTKMVARAGVLPTAPAITYSNPVPAPSPATKPAGHGLFNFFYTPPPSPTLDWGARFTQVARNLGDQGISYDEDWSPPGEAHSWTMDCSNTARYIYKATTGIQLPRTASDQYYYLHLQKKAWDVPMTATGFADCNYLRQNLQAGDLLFWENTYKPDRQPPITHVMVFLGSNVRGQWIMAGSQTTRGGEHNRRHGGPDIYVFNPTRPCGGYSTWLGLVHHQGRFCAFGRPLDADKSKLSVAADD